MRLDDAYANGVHIPDGDGYYARWEAAAADFRQAWGRKDLGVSYGPLPRQTCDLYQPNGAAKGTVVFVHGGYWMAGAPSMFSHLAAGALALGYSFAMPSYTLAPDATVAQITQEIRAALDMIAERTTGPIYLVGHSAGGHLVARMGCGDMAGAWSERVARIMPISPLGDLSPLLETSMNGTLGLDAKGAKAESPIHHAAPIAPVHVWVGGGERPAFLDQAFRLQEAWGCDVTIEAEHHHFDVIEGLEHPASAMMRALFR